ncbi:hypothetical protein [Streptomyces sp. NPDC055400]
MREVDSPDLLVTIRHGMVRAVLGAGGTQYRHGAGDHVSERLCRVRPGVGEDLHVTDDDLILAVREAVADRELPEPAAEEDVRAVERMVGHPMPALLRRLYLEVANGGLRAVGCRVADRYRRLVQRLRGRDGGVQGFR